MKRFLSGFIIGVLVPVAGFYLISGLTQSRPNNLKRCSGDSKICRPNPGRYRGISGSARLSADSHLVVHDAHDGGSQADMARLGIVKDLGDGAYSYTPVNIEKDKWRATGEVSSDLESACRLTHKDHEFLVAESGRVDKRRGIRGKKEPKRWLGRIFHVQLKNPGNKPTAEISKTPNLRLADVSDPKFEKPKDENEYPHSKENYEGMACILLSKGKKNTAKYLVVLGERGGEKTLTGTLWWGEYDTAPKEPLREIKWTTSASLKNIVAPGKGSFSDKKWRDITGLHIDDQHRLFATASYDTGDNYPRYESVMYQLGVICINANDKHGQPALCDYTKSPRPTILSSFSILASSDYHKFESVSAPGGKNPKAHQLSIGAEDEDSSGSWWPSFPKK